MKHIVVLTGAGISAESGLQTFRDSDGLWMGYDIYEVASPAGWQQNPAKVLDFYNMRRRDVATALPNAAHVGLALLEKYYKVTIITQNIDDLHERGGSSNVIHLHGEIFKMRSENDEDTLYEIKGDIDHGNLAADGAQLRPHVVWFDEQVPLIPLARQIVQSADIFVLVGTSLQVYPAAGLVGYTQPSIPKYIIDKKIPIQTAIHNITYIEKPATQCIAELLAMLVPGDGF